MRALILGLALVAACSSVSTSYDFDPEAKFADLKTYKWLTTSKKKSTPSTESSPLVVKRVQRAVDAQLAARGA